MTEVHSSAAPIPTPPTPTARHVSKSGAQARLSLLRVAGRELAAFARQASLIHRDPFDSVPETLPGDEVVVLVHGLFASAGVLRPMRNRLEQELGVKTATFSYTPGPGVHHLATRLCRVVGQLSPHARVHLVGHSLGGVVVRWFVQELGGDLRVVQTVSLGSPFGGTEHARLMPTRAGRDISPGSRVLERLRRGAGMSEVPHLSIGAQEDKVVTGSPYFASGDQVTIDECGHNSLLYDPRAASAVAARIRAFRCEV